MEVEWAIVFLARSLTKHYFTVKRYLMKFLLFIPLLFALQEQDLIRVNISEDISIKVPKQLSPVPDGQIRNRHVHFRKPLALYTDANNEIDLAFNQNPTRWREEDISILKDFYKSNILNLYDDVEFSKEEITEIRGKNFVVFEFISSVKGDANSIRRNTALRKYTYIQYTIFNGSTLVCNLTTPINLKARWAGIAPEIMNSIAFK